MLHNQKQPLKIFLASPLGFSESGRFFLREKVIPEIESEKVHIIDPWRDFDSDERKIQDMMKKDTKMQIKELNEYATHIAARNEKDLRDADMMIAILDGVDVDSGTAAEIGLAYGLGKKVIGYRSDLRQTGENLATTINLQVEYDIINSGGKITFSLQELKDYIKSNFRH